jgi:Uma2 family endonuclease
MIIMILYCQVKENGGYVFSASKAKLGFAYYLLLAGFLLGLFFDPEDRVDVFHRNFEWLLQKTEVLTISY